MILSGRKGAAAPFSCLPARTGPGRARKWVKGLVPCGFSGQRPEPSESFLLSISAIFKVLASLFFSAQFFIDHLTLPVRCHTLQGYLPAFEFPHLHLRYSQLSPLLAYFETQTLYLYPILSVYMYQLEHRNM